MLNKRAPGLADGWLLHSALETMASLSIILNPFFTPSKMKCLSGSFSSSSSQDEKFKEGKGLTWKSCYLAWLWAMAECPCLQPGMMQICLNLQSVKEQPFWELKFLHTCISDLFGPLRFCLNGRGPFLLWLPWATGFSLACKCIFDKCWTSVPHLKFREAWSFLYSLSKSITDTRLYLWTSW